MQRTYPALKPDDIGRLVRAIHQELYEWVNDAGVHDPAPKT